jgi:hypothetical protein
MQQPAYNMGFLPCWLEECICKSRAGQRNSSYVQALTAVRARRSISALVLNFNNIFSNTHLYRAGQSMIPAFANTRTLLAIQMTAFLKKYKWTIFYWVILLFIVLYFAPRQSKYYLDQDIKQFKTQYLIPALIWTFGLLSIGLLVYWLLKAKSIKQSGVGFLSVALSSTFIIFIFQDIFLGVALFANRQIQRDKVIKTYQASFMAGTDHSKNNFSPYDPSTKHISIDKKLINELYNVGLKQNDTITLTMNKGLLGIDFNSHPFDVK